MWKYPGVWWRPPVGSRGAPRCRDRPGLLLRTWLQWLPLEVHLLFLPDTELMMALLAMLVIAVLHLLIFLLVWPLRRPDAKSKYLPRPTGH